MNNRPPPLRPAELQPIEEIHTILVDLRVREEGNTNNPEVVHALSDASHAVHVVRSALRKRFTSNAG